MLTKTVFIILSLFLSSNIKSQIVVKLSNPELNPEIVNIICEYSTYKILLKLNTVKEAKIDTSNLVSLAASHIGYQTLIIEKAQLTSKFYEFKLSIKTITNEAVIITSKERKEATFSDVKKKRLESGFAIDIGETNLGKAYFNVVLPNDVHKVKYLEFRAIGLVKLDTVICTIYNSEVDIFNNTPLLTKTIIIDKKNSNIKLKDIDKLDIDFPTTSFYCTFFVKNSYYDKHRTFIWNRLKEYPSNNYIYYEKTKLLQKSKPSFQISIFEKNKSAIYQHLAYKVIYLK